MLKNIFILWIIFQLIILGGINGHLTHKYTQGELECQYSDKNAEFSYIIIGTIFPLIMFTDQHDGRCEDFFYNK